MPKADWLRQEYMPKCGEKEKEQTKMDFADKRIVLICDETSDSRGRCVFAVLFKTVTPTDQQKVALASCSFLEKANGTTCCQAIIDTIQKYDISYENIDGLVSDSARYMGTCFTAMQVVIGNDLIHYQCWAHKINLIGDVFMKELPELNMLVSKVKMVFLHGRKIKHAYASFLRENYEDLPAVLFPSPVITRWNTWFKSVKYLGTYLDALVHFLTEYDEKNASAITVCEMFENELQSMLPKAQVLFVSEICQPFIDLIEVLEGSKYPFAHLLWDKLESLTQSLKRNANGSFPEKTTQFLAGFKNANKKALTVTNLTSASQKGLQKLIHHMKPCDANKLYKDAGTLFNPAIAGQHLLVSLDFSFCRYVTCILCTQLRPTVPISKY